MAKIIEEGADDVTLKLSYDELEVIQELLYCVIANSDQGELAVRLSDDLDAVVTLSPGQSVIKAGIGVKGGTLIFFEEK